jgi:translation initiation factor IF-3
MKIPLCPRERKETKTLTNKCMIKEIRLRVKETEYEVKLAHATRFLEQNEQVKLIVVFRGREVTYPEAGEWLLLKFAKDLQPFGKAEIPPVREPRQVYLVFVPIAEE